MKEYICIQNYIETSVFNGMVSTNVTTITRRIEARCKDEASGIMMRITQEELEIEGIVRPPIVYLLEEIVLI